MAVSETLLRSMVHDPVGDNQYLTTDQYTAIMALEATEYRAAALAARMIASQFVQKVNLEVGSIKIALRQKYQNYMNLAASYDWRAITGGMVPAPVVGGTSLADMESVDAHSDRPPNQFKMGMFDNPPSTYNADSTVDEL